MSREILLNPVFAQEAKPSALEQPEPTKELKSLASVLSDKGTIDFLRTKARLLVVEKPGEVTPKRRRFTRRRKRINCSSPEHGKPTHRCRRGISLIKG